MAVFHIVWLKFYPNTSEETIRDHLRALDSLPGAISEIRDLSLGENFTDRSAGFTHGMIVTLKDKGDLQVYATHERHLEVAGALREVAELRVMDYEA